ncbi:hypothetical protein [Pseudomonas putida]|uniref:hypothetical protein n=1 Tax=Pseudomonas putida TaxID=303 RepID=UPI0018D949D5|nr:hypothetical protein [Pseudomonas putida]MBH3412812.1 hypothetical protein [Pseudomonas putida]
MNSSSLLTHGSTFTGYSFTGSAALPVLKGSTAAWDAWDECVDYATTICRKIVKTASRAEDFNFWPLPTETIVTPIDFSFLESLYTTDCVTVDESDIVLPAYCSRALSALEHYRTLEEDWDGEGAEAPNVVALGDAEFFLRTLGANIHEAPIARPMLDNEGIPGIFWSIAEKYLSISFYGDFSLTYVYRVKNQEINEAATVALNCVEDIAKLLKIIETL